MNLQRTDNSYDKDSEEADKFSPPKATINHNHLFQCSGNWPRQPITRAFTCDNSLNSGWESESVAVWLPGSAFIPGLPIPKPALHCSNSFSHRQKRLWKPTASLHLPECTHPDWVLVVKVHVLTRKWRLDKPEVEILFTANKELRDQSGI